MKISPAVIEQHLTVPAELASTAVRNDEAHYLYDLMQEIRARRTLEIGMGLGRSAAFIMASTGQPHVAMDPVQESYGNQGIQNLKQLGLISALEFHADYSHHVLPRLVQEGRTFDFIFIDGSHRYDGIFLDDYYADLLLQPNGVMAFHDTWMRSTQLVLSFIRSNRPDYREFPTGHLNIQAVSKTGVDDRDGMHFREFYTARSLARYHLSKWLSGMPDSAAKRGLSTAKEFLRRRLTGR